MAAPALQLRDGGFIAHHAVLEAVTLFQALLRAADESLLRVGAIAEHEVEEVVVRPTDDVAHGRVPPRWRRFLDPQGSENGGGRPARVRFAGGRRDRARRSRAPQRCRYTGGRSRDDEEDAHYARQTTGRQGALLRLLGWEDVGKATHDTVHNAATVATEAKNALTARR